MELNKEQIGFLNERTEGKWTINEKTGLVDIEGDFVCSYEKYEKLTDFKGVKFGVVTGSFYCHGNSLTSLEGAPQEVGGHFNCFHNKLTSLVGAPQKVGERFDCHNNSLESLEGAPQDVSGHFICYNNRLTSLVGAPQKVGGYFDCHYNSLESLEGAPQEVGGGFSCYGNPISEETLDLVWETMQEKKIDYWVALSLLKSQISNGCWKKMSRGLDERLSKDEQKGYSTLGQFGLFG